MSKLPRFALALIASAGLVGAASIASSPALPAAAEPVTMGKLMADKSPALVTIKFQLKNADGGESEEETSGAMIEAGGLVITSNNAFGGMMARFGGGGATPTDIKVLVGDDTQGVKAKFLARDTELGLAWIQVEEPPAKPYAFIDFTQAGESKVGDKLFAISLMGKFFDRAPMIVDGYVSALVSKPRHLVMPSVGIVAGGDQGLPVFDDSGKVVGIATMILPEREEMAGGGAREAMKGFLGMMILPSSDVAAATVHAKETAKNPPAPDKDEEKKDEPKKDSEKPDMEAPKPAAAPK